MTLQKSRIETRPERAKKRTDEFFNMEEAVKKWNLARRDGSLGELWSGTFCRSVQSAESQ
jgi:hypothetical protein